MIWLLRLLGAGAVIAAGGLLGRLQGLRLVRRQRELKSLLEAFALLETEIVYGAEPLPQAFERLGRAGGGAAAFFTSVAAGMGSRGLVSSWTAALSEYYKASCLGPKDREVLEAVGKVLGTSDRADQARHLKLTCQRLRALEDEARIEEMKNGRLFRAAGIVASVALVLVLL